MKRKPIKLRKTTQTELAAALGVSRQLISLHARKPDAPPLNDTAGWTAFLAAHGRDGSAPPDVRRKLAEARLGILLETKARLARENKKAAGEVLDRAEVMAQASAAESYYGAELDRMLRELPPALTGLTAMEILERLKQFVEDLRVRSRENFKVVK